MTPVVCLKLARELLPALLCAASASASGEFTRGVGVYPGDPASFQGPAAVLDTATYRNLALHRPATASSNYDYSLTAQLVTDGIIDGRMPRWIVASSSSEGILPRHEREHLVDTYASTAVNLPAPGGWAQIEQCGRDELPDVDRIEVVALPRTRTGILGLGNRMPFPATRRISAVKPAKCGVFLAIIGKHSVNQCLSLTGLDQPRHPRVKSEGLASRNLDFGEIRVGRIERVVRFLGI